MAKAKKSTKKRFTDKVHDLTKKDVLSSVAVVSIALNVLFLAAILVLTSTGTFSREIYTATRDQYCKNKSALKDRAEKIGDRKLALQERTVDCIGEGFKPFYEEAVEKYRAQSSDTEVK